MIGFIGLSHLGLVYSLATASKGFQVVAYDPDPTLVKRLGRGDFPIKEPGFTELFSAHAGRLRYTSDASELGKCDLVFYSLDVPTNAQNESDTGPLEALVGRTQASIPGGACTVLLSQVRPGTTRALASGGAKGKCPLYYQVETLVFGAAVRRATEPERFIVGAADPEAPLPPSYRAWLEAFGCPVLPMRYESAELAKIAINLFLVSSVSTTNMLAGLCEAIGADWSEIAPALRLDRRIGPHAYLKPGLGIAGGNLERDIVTVRALAGAHGTEAGLVEAWLANSADARFWALRQVEERLTAAHPRARIAVWGLAYKEDTHSLKNSASIELIRTLTACDIHAYDPAAKIEGPSLPNLTVEPTALAALDQAEALLIMTPWREFQAADPRQVRARMGGTLVIDPYGVLDGKAAKAAGLHHLVMGRG